MTDESIIGACREAVRLVRKARVPPLLAPVAFGRVLTYLLGPPPPHAVEVPKRKDDGKWRCPHCDGRAQALADPSGGPTQYGCARGHALILAPEDADL